MVLLYHWNVPRNCKSIISKSEWFKVRKIYLTKKTHRKASKRKKQEEEEEEEGEEENRVRESYMSIKWRVRV